MVKSVVKSLPEGVIDLQENVWILVLHLNDNFFTTKNHIDVENVATFQLDKASAFNLG